MRHVLKGGAAIALLAGAVLAGGDGAADPASSTPTLKISRAGSQASIKGSAEQFTGAVRIDPLFQGAAPARAAGASVTFGPGARTAWHTHPLGQTLIVTAGAGRVQLEGGPIEEIRPGDVISIPPNQRHWHGASPTTGMTWSGRSRSPTLSSAGSERGRRQRPPRPSPRSCCSV